MCNEKHHNGQLIYDSGVHTQIFEANNGCDSVVVMDFAFINNGFGLGFSANQQLFTEPPYAVQFTNTTTDLENYNFTWNFGDGTILQSNNLNVFHEYTSSGSFSVSLFATDLIGSCSDSFVETDYIFIAGESSVHEEGLNFYHLYPNPTSKKIIIQTETLLQNAFVIHDQQGREIMKGALKGKQTEISLENLKSGTYTIQIEGKFKPRIIVKQ